MLPRFKKSKTAQRIVFGVTFLFAIALIAYGLTGCAKPSGPPAFATGVVTRKITNSTVPDQTDYVATLISRQSVSLQSQVPGQVKEIYVKAGDFVGKGTLLLLIDPAQQQASVASAAAAAQSQRAGVAQARAGVQNLQEQRRALESAVQVAQSQYSRYESLASTNSVSRQEVERFRDELTRAQANLQANDAQLNAQRAAITTAQKQYEQANASTRAQQVQLQYYRITAPFSGIVGDIPMKVGNYIQPSDLLLSVTNNTPLEVNISVPAEKATELRSGLPVQILNENGAVLGQATINFVSPSIDPNAQTILAKAILPNPGGLLKADQVVNARIIWRQTFGVRVPVEAVIHMGGRDFVYTVAPKPPPKKGEPEPMTMPGMPEAKHVARQVPITVSRIEGQFYVVESGLKPGDELIVAGAQKLSDGALILPQTEAQANAAPKPAAPAAH